MNTLREQDFEWFETHNQELYKRYPNKELLIHNKEVVEVFDNDMDAYKVGVDLFGLGNFIIQNSNMELETATFHSRISF
jgi:hypothetical protein